MGLRIRIGDIVSVNLMENTRRIEGNNEMLVVCILYLLPRIKIRKSKHGGKEYEMFHCP